MTYRLFGFISLLALNGCGTGGADPESAVDNLAQDDADDDRERKIAEWEASPPTLAKDAPEGDVAKPSYVDSSGFFVFEGRLYDAFGNDFVLRGVNNAHAWFDTAAVNALDDLSNFGFNSVRIVWESEAKNPRMTPRFLRRVLYTCVENHMIPMIEIHDATGKGQNELLLKITDYLLSDEVREVLLDYEDYLLINIANEWSGNDFLGGYTAAIEALRDGGLNHTLVIDANGWGQNADVIFEHGADLLELDPQHNLLFSNHMYERYSGAGGNRLITDVMERAVEQQLPFMVGEFGWQHGEGRLIDVPHIFAEATRLGIGYMPWSWKGNSQDVAYLDMSEDWSGNNLTEWGEQVIYDENGIANTAMRASIFVIEGE